MDNVHAEARSRSRAGLMSTVDELKIMFIGDWGQQLFGILHSQQRVAKAMSVWAETGRPAWIQTVGDNIYPAGIQSWDDWQVDSKWRFVYNQSSLRQLVWHMALGNHDYGVLLTDEWNQVHMQYLIVFAVTVSKEAPCNFVAECRKRRLDQPF